MMSGTGCVAGFNLSSIKVIDPNCAPKRCRTRSLASSLAHRHEVLDRVQLDAFSAGSCRGSPQFVAALARHHTTALHRTASAEKRTRP
jgi:hypothetical protein